MKLMMLSIVAICVVAYVSALFFGTQMIEAQKRVEDLRGQVAYHENMTEALQNQTIILESQTNNPESQTRVLEFQINDLQAQKQNLQTQINDLQAQQESLETQINDSKARTEDLQSQARDLESQINNLQTQIKEVQNSTYNVTFRVVSLGGWHADAYAGPPPYFKDIAITLHNIGATNIGGVTLDFKVDGNTTNIDFPDIHIMSPLLGILHVQESKNMTVRLITATTARAQALATCGLTITLMLDNTVLDSHKITIGP